MEKFKLNINGKEVKGLPGQTILEVARENDIFIPTLCYDERTRILYGSCGLCMCEMENPKLCKACATVIAPGMVIRTNTERVIESRKTKPGTAAFQSYRRLPDRHAYWHVRSRLSGDTLGLIASEV